MSMVLLTFVAMEVQRRLATNAKGVAFGGETGRVGCCGSTQQHESTRCDMLTRLLHLMMAIASGSVKGAKKRTWSGLYAISCTALVDVCLAMTTG